MQDSICGTDAFGLDAVDLVGDDLRIRLGNRGVERLRYDESLAACRVVGRQLRPELAVGNVLVEIPFAAILHHGQRFIVLTDDRGGEPMIQRVGEGAVEAIHLSWIGAENWLLLQCLALSSSV